MCRIRTGCAAGGLGEFLHDGQASPYLSATLQTS